MWDFTLIILGKEYKFEKEVPFEIIYYNGNLKDTVRKVKTKYVLFIKSTDYLGDNYFKNVLKKIKCDFDCCFINYKCNYLNYDKQKIPTDYWELKGTLPLYGSYIWSFIFRTSKLLRLFDYRFKDEKKFNDYITENFKITDCINEIVYYHKPNAITVLKEDTFPYVDRKSYTHLNNVIYIGLGCTGTFNGYVSWIRNIALCFSDKYELTLMYDDISDRLYNEFSKKYNCVKVDPKTNYLIERLLVTYSNYFYPRNLICLDRNYMFIHGNAADYKHSKRYRDNVYTNYAAVSQIAAKSAMGYYPTDHIDCIYNPYKVDEERLKPHMTLCTTMRSSDIKRPERIAYLAKILDELEIPYTWNMFTDKNENTNINGLVYRRRLLNPMPYVKAADYFVLFSDSESFSYSVVEALSVNTKVVVTPLDVYKEIGVVDGKNGYVVPFDYFDEKNKDKLKELVLKMYANKDKEFNYVFDPKLYEGFNDIFIKGDKK